MSKTTLKYTAVALALSHAYALPVLAQSEPQAVTEVVITASRMGLADSATAGGFSDSPLVDTPASVTAFSRTQMEDLRIRQVTDAMKFEASAADSYNAVGYAEQFSIRGFNLDNASSYRKDGFAIPGDAQVPLENKDAIEILKGLSGLQAGVAAPGGMVNFVTKRPTKHALRSATAEVRERGTLYGALDLGGRFGDTRFGYRINAAAERLRSYVRGADGERQFASAAFDWQLSPRALLQLDMDYQHKSQVTAPGYQLIGGVSLPRDVSPETLLNDQPWTRPVDTESSNLGLRFEYEFDSAWRATLAANKHWFKRDDYAAFPYGCSQESLWPGFCANGDYDVYDYQSVGERKTPVGAQALLQGRFATGTLSHALTLGTSLSERHDAWGDYVYDWAGVSNIYRNVAVPPAPPERTTGPVYERLTDKERALFAQDIVGLSTDLKLHAGLRYVSVRRRLADDPRGTDFNASFVLPNVALVYKPAKDWSVYGSVAHGMEHGGVAPFGTENQFLPLDPSRSRQLELGAKAQVGQDYSLSAAVFQITKGLEYTDATNTFVRNGEQVNRGIEFAAHGRATPSLRYGLSAMALHTEQQGTGNPAMDGKRATNVPAFKSTAWFDYSVQSVAGLTLNGAFQYSGKKAFDTENRVFVPYYSVFNVGAAYETRAAGGVLTLRANVDNAFDTFYWRDVTPLLGGYLFPGAPRTFRLSAQYDF